jgi:predicted nucleic acid-binding protein
VSDRIFVDTNVFVYADDKSSGAKRDQARAVLEPLLAERTAVVSTQVMQEYFVAATRKLKLAAVDARRRVESLGHLDVVVIRPELILGAIDLHRLHALSFWDALVIRSASAAGCSTLLTEDLQHGSTIDGVRITNPFTTSTRASEPRAQYATLSRAPRSRSPSSRPSRRRR